MSKCIMKEQFYYFIQDIKRLLGKRKIRIIHIWMSRVFWGLLIYRSERGLYIMLGRSYSIIRVLFLPLLNLIQAYCNMELHYKSDIGGGVLVLHPCTGAVVSAYSIIGSNLTLTGGNIIGSKAGSDFGSIRIGNNCTLGANAVIIGPIQLANNIVIGASSCVVNSCLDDGLVLVGVPAQRLIKSKDEGFTSH